MSPYLPEQYWDERLRRHFDLRGTGHLEHGGYYNSWLYRAKVRGVRAALRLAGLDVRGAAVLDAGCGTGFFIERYERWGAAYVAGVDLSPTSVQRLRSRFPSVPFWQADIASGIPTAEEFDLVQALDVLYHLPDESFPKALTHLARRCRAGGILLVSDWLHGTRAVAPHVTFRSRQAYAEVLIGVGVQIVGEVPLYRFLNRSGWGRWGGIGRLATPISDLAAPLWYVMDRVALNGRSANLSLLVGRRVS